MWVVAAVSVSCALIGSLLSFNEKVLDADGVELQPVERVFRLFDHV